MKDLLKKNQALLKLVFSLVIVALGQPARSPALGMISAAVGLALFFHALESFKKIFTISLVWFTAVQLIQLSWMTSIEFQGLYILGVYAVLSLGLGVQFALLAIQIPSPSPLSWGRIIYLASFWTLMEWARLFLLCGFSWNPLGLALTCSETALQCASIFGVFGLSFWVVLTNLLFLKMLRQKRFLFTPFLCALTPYICGALLLALHSTKTSLPTQRIALLQTSWLPSEKVPQVLRLHEFLPPFEQWKKVVTTLKNAHNVDAEKWDLLVFPEAALFLQADAPFYPAQTTQAYFTQLFGPQDPSLFPPLRTPYAQFSHGEMRVTNLFWSQTLANILHTDIIVGFDYRDAIGNKNFNSAFYLKPGSTQVERYDKQILLPLAESLPFAWAKHFTQAYGISEFFTEGQGFPLWGGRFSPSICYEETFPSFMHQARLAGAQLFVNLTNDNYYPNSSLHLQHLFHARVRAVENGIPLIRSCNAGVSALIDRFGHIVAHLPASEAGVCISSLETQTHQTFFSLYGHTGLIVGCFLVIAVFWILRYKTP